MYYFSTELVPTPRGACFETQARQENFAPILFDMPLVSLQNIFVNRIMRVVLLGLSSAMIMCPVSLASPPKCDSCEMLSQEVRRLVKDQASTASLLRVNQAALGGLSLYAVSKRIKISSNIYVINT